MTALVYFEIEPGNRKLASVLIVACSVCLWCACGSALFDELDGSDEETKPFNPDQFSKGNPFM